MIVLVANWSSSRDSADTRVSWNSHYKCFKACTLLIWASIVFTAGFIVREVAAYNYDSVPLYIAQSVLLLVAPPVYEGANYIILGRILYYVPYLSPLHPGRVVTTFMGLDLAVAVLTANGGARLSSTTASERKSATDELKAALILQVVCMVCFVCLTARYHYKVTKAGLMRPKLRRPILVLYASCTLIIIRTIYRTVEYFAASASVELIYSGQLKSDSQLSPLLKNEWFFWVFEASVMFINSSLLNTFHPMAMLPQSNKIYLDRDGVTEIEGPGIQDTRPFIMTILDPFDLVGLFKGRDKEQQFWETRGEPKQVRQEA